MDWLSCWEKSSKEIQNWLLKGVTKSHFWVLRETFLWLVIYYYYLWFISDAEKCASNVLDEKQVKLKPLYFFALIFNSYHFFIRQNSFLLFSYKIESHICRKSIKLRFFSNRQLTLKSFDRNDYPLLWILKKIASYPAVEVIKTKNKIEIIIQLLLRTEKYVFRQTTDFLT